MVPGLGVLLFLYGPGNKISMVLEFQEVTVDRQWVKKNPFVYAFIYVSIIYVCVYVSVIYFSSIFLSIYSATPPPTRG
jgi:hypothetical protein